MAEGFLHALVGIGVQPEIASVVTEGLRRTDDFMQRFEIHEAELKRQAGICEQLQSQIGVLADQLTDVEATVGRLDEKLTDVADTQRHILLSDPGSEIRHVVAQVQDLTARVTQVSSEVQGLAQRSTATAAEHASATGLSNAPAPTQPPISGPGFVTDVRMVEKPAPFSGDKADAAALGAFFASVEQYFYVCGITNPVQMGNIAVMWLRGNAQVWWRTIRANTDLASFTWDQLKAKMEVQFQPYDCDRQARDQWAACVQGKDAVAGYIQRYRECLLRVKNPSPSEVLDRFTRNLAPNIKGLIYLFAPSSFEDAALAAERVDAALRASGPILPTTAPASASAPSSGPVPMQLGAASSPSGRSPSRPRVAPFACHYCGTHGHGWKQCNKLFGEMQAARSQPAASSGRSFFPRAQGGRLPSFPRGGRPGRGGPGFANSMGGSFSPAEMSGFTGSAPGFATANSFEGLPVYPPAPPASGQPASSAMPPSSAPGSGQ